MKKIEDVTCIKFEERSKNHHPELVSDILLLISLPTIFDKKKQFCFATN